MKHLLIPALLLVSLMGNSQSTAVDVNQTTEVKKIQCTNFFVTPPLKNAQDESILTSPNHKKAKDRIPTQFNIQTNNTDETVDEIRQSSGGSAGPVLIDVNTGGMNGGFPPDPSGAIGPNHYVQAVNTHWRVYETDGSPDGFPLALSSIWPDSENNGDPIVMYDQFVDRWFISQFQTATNSVLIAISVTPDPTEEYYAYEFDFNQFPDYPKYSIWGNAYYLTANSGGQDLAVFERDKMIAGDATASMIAFNVPNAPGGVFESMLPADADGMLPPADAPNYLFYPGDDLFFGNGSDHIKVYEVDVNWDSPNSSDVNLVQEIPVSSFNSNFGNNNFGADWDNIPQPGTNQKLDAVHGYFTYRAQFRKWLGYNTVVLTMVVDVDGNNNAGIRWYELRQSEDSNGNVGDWTVHQQGTYAPDDNNHRWLASASMDDYGNIGLAYSIGGEDMSASLACTGRYRNDPLGEMTLDETIIIEGSGAQVGGNRFGDYSHMTLAPDGETFWFTGEYLSNGNGRTRIASFKINSPLSVESNVETIEKSIYQNGSELFISLSNLPDSKLVQLDIFDNRGALVSSRFATQNGNSITESINVSDLATGTYFVRFGNSDYENTEKVFIQN